MDIASCFCTSAACRCAHCCFHVLLLRCSLFRFWKRTTQDSRYHVPQVQFKLSIVPCGTFHHSFLVNDADFLVTCVNWTWNCPPQFVRGCISFSHDPLWLLNWPKLIKIELAGLLSVSDNYNLATEDIKALNLRLHPISYIVVDMNSSQAVISLCFCHSAPFCYPYICMFFLSDFLEASPFYAGLCHDDGIWDRMKKTTKVWNIYWLLHRQSDLLIHPFALPCSDTHHWSFTNDATKHFMIFICSGLELRLLLITCSNGWIIFSKHDYFILLQ